MKRVWISMFAVAIAISLVVTLSAGQGPGRGAGPQRGGPAARGAPAPPAAPAAPAEPAPRMSDGHPDLSGVWWGGGDVGGRGFRRGGGGAAGPSYTSLYNAEAQAKAKTMNDSDDPTLRCVPVAFGTLNVSLYSVGAVGQIISTPKF